MGMRGTYRVIEAPHRSVHTESFDAAVAGSPSPRAGDTSRLQICEQHAGRTSFSAVVFREHMMAQFPRPQTCGPGVGNVAARHVQELDFLSLVKTLGAAFLIASCSSQAL